ncbi:MAG: GTP cyclohydrolase I FolE [Candidatus Lokiarchaeota archaeon]|nr:GTP cyclohydrolase I FolE [Candidatus Lokiarchaeota archaeon]
MDKKKVESLVKELLIEIEGESNLREGTLNTPKRVANAYSEIFNGYEQDLEEDITIFKASYSEIIISKDIRFYSMCEHHILPYYGKVDIAYLPFEHILGISKFARIVNYFSHRLNVQERMTDNIANYIMNSNLKPRGVMVIVKGTHLCEIMRGVKEPNPIMITSAIKGIFKENIATRNEALQLLKI